MIEYSAVTLSKDDLNSQGRLRDLLIFPYKYTETSTCILAFRCWTGAKISSHPAANSTEMTDSNICT